MSGAGIAVLVVVALALVVLIGLLVSYNRFVSQRTLVEESWHDIDVELTRRHDLIPNLVATVKGYAAHEAALLDAVTRAREAAEAHRTDAPEQRASYESAVGAGVQAVLVRAEAYPDLKASANFLDLQHQLTDTEDRLAASRRFYNGNVRAYNIRVESLPSALVARMGGFTKREFFEADASARAVPGVV